MENPENSSKVTAGVDIDPVCGMKVSPEERDFVYSYRGISYHFCATACRDAFEQDPRKYMSSKPYKRKGIWGRYLDRLNKTTNGQAIKCH